jgi:hypothetical protein
MARAQIRIDACDEGLARSLTSFLEHTIYAPVAPQGSTVSVTGPDGLPPHIARAEIGLYLEAWNRLHPEVSASLID